MTDLENYYDISIHDGAESMGNNDSRPLLPQRFHSILDPLLSQTVQGGCCLIKQQYQGIPQQRSCKSYPLLLASTQPQASFTYHGLIVLGEALRDGLVYRGCFSTLVDVVVIC